VAVPSPRPIAAAASCTARQRLKGDTAAITSGSERPPYPVPSARRAAARATCSAITACRAHSAEISIRRTRDGCAVARTIAATIGSESGATDRDHSGELGARHLPKLWPQRLRSDPRTAFASCASLDVSQWPVTDLRRSSPVSAGPGTGHVVASGAARRSAGGMGRFPIRLTACLPTLWRRGGRGSRRGSPATGIPATSLGFGRASRSTTSVACASCCLGCTTTASRRRAKEIGDGCGRTRNISPRNLRGSLTSHRRISTTTHPAGHRT